MARDGYKGIMFYLTDAQADKLMALADHNGLTLSALIRIILVQKLNTLTTTSPLSDVVEVVN